MERRRIDKQLLVLSGFGIAPSGALDGGLRVAAGRDGDRDRLGGLGIVFGFDPTTDLRGLELAAKFPTHPATFAGRAENAQLPRKNKRTTHATPPQPGGEVSEKALGRQPYSVANFLEEQHPCASLPTGTHWFLDGSDASLGFPTNACRARKTGER
jgi:hypothetical protein